MPPHPTIGNPIGQLNGGPGLGSRPIYHRDTPARGRGRGEVGGLVAVIVTSLLVKGVIRGHQPLAMLRNGIRQVPEAINPRDCTHSSCFSQIAASLFVSTDRRHLGDAYVQREYGGGPPLPRHGFAIRHAAIAW
jgi:hypothetical protein